MLLLNMNEYGLFWLFALVVSVALNDLVANLKGFQGLSWGIGASFLCQQLYSQLQDSPMSNKENIYDYSWGTMVPRLTACMMKQII